MPLTDEQLRIVNHGAGAAVVYAVAGSGKTHTMVERICRLVGEKVFPPQKILATTFNKAAVREIRDRLVARGFEGISCQTLHSLGHTILRDVIGDQPTLAGSLEAKIPLFREARQALAQSTSISLSAAEKRELRLLDADTFFKWLAGEKVNIRYVDPDSEDLPPEAREVASFMEPPPGYEWFVPLAAHYRRCMEDKRQFDFEDMLLKAWECLVKYPRVLENWRGRFTCIVADEFQDFNLVQYEIVKLLGQEHGNVMAIGDDDQTINEWCGASALYMQRFRQEFSADSYQISDNFRCQAGQIILANAVISQNRNRVPKSLSPTKAFRNGIRIVDGSTEYEKIELLLQALVTEHGTNHRSWRDMAVLVRAYHQAGLFRALCRREGIPYRMERDDTDFFQGSHVRATRAYLELIHRERMIGGTAPGGDLPLEAGDCLNKPLRGLGANQIDWFNKAVQTGKRPSQACADLAVATPNSASSLLRMSNWIRERAQDESWIHGPAKAILEDLFSGLGFLESHGATDTQSADVGSIDSIRQAILDLSYPIRGLEALRSFLSEEALHAATIQDPDADAILVTSVFKAKGREWPVVALPSTDIDGFHTGIAEEERRLMYVGLTRAKEILFLGNTPSRSASDHLRMADWETLVADSDQVGVLLETDPSTWTAAQTSTARTVFQERGLLRYLFGWGLQVHDHSWLEGMASRLHDLGTLCALPVAPDWSMLASGGSGTAFPDSKEFLASLHTRTTPRKPLVNASDAPKTVADVAPPDPFAVGAKVRSPDSGEGEIVERAVFGSSRKALIRFESGERWVFLDIELRKGLTSIESDPSRSQDFKEAT